MNKNYIILTILMLVLAVGTIFLTMNDEPNQIEPTELLHDESVAFVTDVKFAESDHAPVKAKFKLQDS